VIEAASSRFRILNGSNARMYHVEFADRDSGMMGQFVVVEPGAEDRVPRTLAAAGPHAGHH